MLVVEVKYLNSKDTGAQLDVRDRKGYYFLIREDKFISLTKGNFNCETSSYWIETDRDYINPVVFTDISYSTENTTLKEITTISRDILHGPFSKIIGSLSVRTAKAFIEARKIIEKNNKEKERGKVMSIKEKFKFGPANDVAMSIYGPVFYSADGGRAYDEKTQSWVEVEDCFIISGFDKFFYSIPAAVKDIAVGDYIRHNGDWVRVKELATEGKGLRCEYIYRNEIVEILPSHSPFGFDFVTKLVNLFGSTNSFLGTPSGDSPFGNILPLMLMGDNKDFKSMLPLMLMSNGNGFNFGDNSNPFITMMMLKALSKDGDCELPF